MKAWLYDHAPIVTIITGIVLVAAFALIPSVSFYLNQKY